MFQVQLQDSLIGGDSYQLVSLLQSEGLSSSALNTLDQWVTKDLSGRGFSRVVVVLKSLRILSENRGDVQTLLDYGLTTKVLLWFKAVCDLLTSDLHKSSAPLLSLTEEFFDYFLVLSQASLPVSQLSVVLLQLAQFTLEPELHFPLRLEAIRTFNSILESLSREQRRLIQNEQNQNKMLEKVAAAVLTVGDYELQVSLSEALCRLTPRKDRQQRANHWFCSSDISGAFCDIRDGDFEVDCRRFLNFVNRYHGDQRRIYTFPCVRAFLDSTQLFPPKDDKLDEFWIDFNVGSGCVSFFVDEPQGFLWGSIHLLREDVDNFILQVTQDECTAAKTVLSVQLINPIMHHSSRGQKVELSFNYEHQRELEEAAERVFTRVKGAPCGSEPGDPVKAPPPAKGPGRSYNRKKPQSKSQLKILPLSSPSSDDDSSVMKNSGKSRAEFLFDQIRHSTPKYDSGAPVHAEPQVSQEHEFAGSSSPILTEVFSRERKRVAADSGYLSDQTEGTTANKRRVEPQTEEEEPHSSMTECSPEEAGPPTGEEGVFEDWAGSNDKREAPVNTPGSGPESELTSDITAAFRSFKERLEHNFTGGWTTIQNQVLLSLRESQQQVSSLLTAVHQHRLLLLQKFENDVTDQLKQLEENSTTVNSMNTQILSFFQNEMQRLGSFCDEHQQRLKCLVNGQSENPSTQ
ncbi:synaptonemal complex protein 2-like isoform X2 [Pleuronectes platessa]|uniref:synaptonemal complex protein 2-like isoform X2 n=1 Tax=Pleuronectes platessa TaxID=8262 RepID=UPI00232A4CA4|nr:synaptonemal complex protein 2-like isoform X2 [Pleuronectes platessa]